MGCGIKGWIWGGEGEDNDKSIRRVSRRINKRVRVMGSENRKEKNPKKKLKKI